MVLIMAAYLLLSTLLVQCNDLDYGSVSPIVGSACIAGFSVSDYGSVSLFSSMLA
jgi:hypothetical protein